MILEKVLNKPFDLVLFGGTGDLSLRKLLPSMFRAFMEDEVPPGSRILVSSRKQADFDNTVETIKTAFKKFMLKNEFNPKRFAEFEKLLVPVLVDVAEQSKGWKELAELFEGRNDIPRIFYLAIIPIIYGDCCENIDKAGLVTQDSRVVVEKPIGYDQQSAEAINQKIAEHFQEEQIYRIDHYLGKETVQNLLALRFSNSLFEQFWDSKIDRPHPNQHQ